MIVLYREHSCDKDVEKVYGDICWFVQTSFVHSACFMIFYYAGLTKTRTFGS